MYSPLHIIQNQKNQIVAGIDIIYNYYLNIYGKIYYIEYHIGRKMNKEEIGYFINTIGKIYLIPIQFSCRKFIDYINNGIKDLYNSPIDIYLDYAKYYLQRNLTENEVSSIKKCIDNNSNYSYSFDSPNQELDILKQIEKIKENLL